MEIIQTLQKWGNGTGIRLPQVIIQEAHIRLGQQFIVTIEKNKIILSPITKNNSLENLLAGVSPDQIGGEMDCGFDIGAEMYE